MASVNLRLMDIIVLLSALSLIFTQDQITGAEAGFILAFASSISSDVNWFLVNLQTIELKGISLERTAEYRMLEHEESQSLNSNSHSRDDQECADTMCTVNGWPSHGALEVTELRARYGEDLPEILIDVSFSVAGGERIGIVGSTGGGKSTLAKAFFSFVDITRGKIEIDGRGETVPLAYPADCLLDISTIPLGLVRSKLGIIAQDPILLSGSLRLNLDLEGSYTDEQLYDALHRVQLIKRDTSSEDASISSSAIAVSSNNPDGRGQQNIFTNLDSEIKSGGEKWV